MDLTRRAVALGGAGLLATVSHLPANALDAPLFDPVEAADDFWLAVDAYIYGYPLVTMEITRRVITNVEQPEGSKGRWATSSSCGNIPTPPSRT